MQRASNLCLLSILVMTPFSIASTAAASPLSDWLTELKRECPEWLCGENGRLEVLQIDAGTGSAGAHRDRAQNGRLELLQLDASGRAASEDHIALESYVDRYGQPLSVLVEADGLRVEQAGQRVLDSQLVDSVFTLRNVAAQSVARSHLRVVAVEQAGVVLARRSLR